MIHWAIQIHIHILSLKAFTNYKPKRWIFILPDSNIVTNTFDLARNIHVESTLRRINRHLCDSRENTYIVVVLLILEIVGIQYCYVPDKYLFGEYTDDYEILGDEDKEALEMAIQALERMTKEGSVK